MNLITFLKLYFGIGIIITFIFMVYSKTIENKKLEVEAKIGAIFLWLIGIILVVFLSDEQIEKVHQILDGFNKKLTNINKKLWEWQKAIWSW